MTSDEGSAQLKRAVQEHLVAQGYTILDLGSETADQEMVYTRAGHMAAEAIRKGDADLGVIFCGSGAGVCITANKHKGIYAVVCESVQTARGARIVNNANILCMGANIVKEDQAKEMADAFLSAEFAQDKTPESRARLSEFIDQIRGMEEKFR